MSLSDYDTSLVFPSEMILTGCFYFFEFEWKLGKAGSEVTTLDVSATWTLRISVLETSALEELETSKIREPAVLHSINNLMLES